MATKNEKVLAANIAILQKTVLYVLQDLSAQRLIETSRICQSLDDFVDQQESESPEEEVLISAMRENLDELRHSLENP